jgi:hypothetical protein
MNGMEMLMRSMGIDPKQMVEQAQQIGGVVLEVAAALKRIEENQHMEMRMLEALLTQRDVKMLTISETPHSEKEVN